jgi:hypothetical protein
MNRFFIGLKVNRIMTIEFAQQKQIVYLILKILFYNSKILVKSGLK